jgi:uncharacterized SAM-binding protein YcdF (DUF218 family)
VKLIFNILGLFFRLLSFVGIAAVVVFFLLIDFMSRSDPYELGGKLPRTAIVFTGDFDRIHLGLDLLSSGSVGRLFVTGVNGDAGLNVARFPKQFELKPDQTAMIETGQITLAPDAHTTLENALEAACWLDIQPDIEAVTLITSRRHMARASVALQHVIAPISVVRVVSNSSDKYDKLQIDLVEFSKFVATWFMTLLPRDIWPANEPALCWGR